MRNLRLILVSLVLGCSGPAGELSGQEVEPQPAVQGEQPQGTAQQVAALVLRGRDLLDRGQLEGALTLFEEAAALDQESLDTRMWVLRVWMDQGRTNDTLDALDALKRGGETGPRMDYLFGMAFVRRAEGMVAEGTVSSAVRMNMASGYELLSKVLPENERLFRDGWITLARAAWHEAGTRSEPEDARAVRATARNAADRAVSFYPSHVDAHLMRGRVAFSQFVAELPEGAEAPEQWGPAAPHWDAAVRSFGIALRLAKPTATDTTQQMLAATAGMQLGNALMWRQERTRAADAYAQAISWAPWAVDFSVVYEALYQAEADEPLSHVLAALEPGQAAYLQHFGGETEGDATTLWWLGWTYLQQGQRFEESEECFSKVLEKWPAYVDAWYYRYRARYGSEDWAGAAASLAGGWKADGVTILRLMKEGDVAENVACVEFLKARVFADGELEQAVALAEVVAEAQPLHAVHWNDLGLFRRFLAEELRANDTPDGANSSVYQELYESAWRDYARALVLEPENPQLINDAAVILQFGLQRDFEMARAMYQKAQVLAAAALESQEIEEQQREVYVKALEDARMNEAELPDPEFAED